MTSRVMYNGSLYELRHLGRAVPIKDLPNEAPLRDNETITVYHGFSDETDAYEAITKGISGKMRAKRIYSYENNNNPYGLFVAPDIKTAREFAHSGFIIEFNCKVSQLEAPVWPGGSFTTQGQMAMYFNSEDEREAERIHARNDYKAEPHEFINKADRPEVAGMLSMTNERQALFTGDLNPNMIRAVWYKPRGSYTFERLSIKEALKKFNMKYVDIDNSGRHNHKIQKPNDDFSLEMLKNLLSSHGLDPESYEHILHTMFRTGDINEYFWPKQVAQIKEILDK